jgi:hypothetical protein
MNALPPACREFLLALDARSPVPEHAAGCPACAAHAAFRSRIAPLLRVAPPIPAALRSPDALAAIHERIVDAAERAPLGRLLADHAAPPAPVTAWPEPALEGTLAAAVRTAPPLPSPVAWSHVRRSILGELASRRIARVRVGVWIGLLGAAATAAVSGLLFADGTREPVTIVFTDLESAPGNEFAVLRYGALR